MASKERHYSVDLLVPAAKADGGKLEVSGWDKPAPTTASTEAVRLALAGGLLSLMEMGGTGTCSTGAGSDAVVRFSHESARTCTLDPAIAASLADEKIVIQRGDRGGKASDLLMVFPGS